MPSLFVYLLKANIALTLFYLAYYFGLRRLTFYSLNRAFLLAGIAFSATYPAINLSSFFQQHQQLATKVIYLWQPTKVVVAPWSFSIWDASVVLFWTGVLVMMIRFMLQLVSLRSIHQKSVMSFIKGWRVRTTSENINPFSFFKNIYINPSCHTLPEADNILKHEIVHVRQWHTLDVLAAEINTIFYWFNPGAWLMKNAVKQNLEFIADRKVLNSGADSKTYQYNLVSATVTQHSPVLANNFNLAHLKNRIIMMNKKRSSHLNLLKYLLLLPLVVILLVFTISDAQIKKAKDKKAAYSHSPAIKTDSIPQKQVASVRVDSVKKSMYIMNDSNNDDSSITNIKVVTTVSPGVIKTDSDVAITVHGNDKINTNVQVFTVTYDNADDSAYVISGKATGSGYAHSGNGTIVMASEEGKNSQSVYVVSSNGTADSTGSGNNTPLRITVTQDTTLTITGSKHPLYVVDGKIVHSIKDINPGDIASISVLKGDSAVAIYGQKAKDGVIIITSKKKGQQ